MSGPQNLGNGWPTPEGMLTGQVGEVLWALRAEVRGLNARAVYSPVQLALGDGHLSGQQTGEATGPHPGGA